MSVYFAQVGPHIKIGYSANPERRVRNLFKSTTRYGVPDGTPLDLASRHLIRYIDGEKDTERQIHMALDDFRIGTEWFVDEPEVREFIANVEPADEYEPVRRPGGPVPYGRPMTDEERDLLAKALQNLFKPLDESA